MTIGALFFVVSMLFFGLLAIGKSFGLTESEIIGVAGFFLVLGLLLNGVPFTIVRRETP